MKANKKTDCDPPSIRPTTKVAQDRTVRMRRSRCNDEGSGSRRVRNPFTWLRWSRWGWVLELERGVDAGAGLPGRL